MGRKHDAPNESFMYKVISYDHIHKIYTLENKKTGAVINMPKDDFENRLAEQNSCMKVKTNG
jgi:hypothetical protein